MRRWLLRRGTLAAALVAVASAGVHAQTRPAASPRAEPLRLELLGASERIVEPGERVTLLVRVSGGVGSAESDVQIPAGWQLVAGRGTLPLATAPTAPLVISLIAPAAAHGRFPIVIRVIPAAVSRPLGVAPTGGVTLRATIIVPERAAFTLQLLEAPSHLVAEQDYRSAFMVRNSGNRTADIILAARATRGGPAVLNLRTFRLGAGQQRVVTVTATAPRAPVTHDELIITVAEARAGGRDSATARLSHRMRVVPRDADQGSPLQTIPMRASIRTAGAPTAGSTVASGTTYELVGRGHLRRGSTTRVELVARYSEAINVPFAIRNEFRAAATGTWGNVTLGHARYGLTPLTSSSLLLLGAGGELRAGPISIAAHAGYDDRRPDDSREAAAQLGVRVPFGIELAATTVLRQRADGSKRAYHTGGVSLPLLGAGIVRAEVALPVEANAPLRGWAVNASGAPFGFTYSAQLLDGDSTWIGPRRGVLERSAAISTPTLARVRIYATHSSRQQNRLDPLELADSVGTLSAIIDRSSLTTAGVAVGSWLRAERRDVLQSYNFVGTRALREETGVNLVGSWRGGRRFNATALYFRGNARTDSSAEWRPFYRTTATATLRMVGRNAITLFADRQVTPDRSPDGSIARTGLGAQLALDSRRTGTSLLIGGRQNRGTGISLGAGAGVAVLAQRSVDASLQQSLPGGYTIAVRWRAVESSTRAAPWLQVGAVEMTIPLALPVGKRHDVGGITVEVLDESTGRPERGVLVLVGNRGAVTGRDGRVTMYELPPGAYAVQIDRSTVPRGRVSTHDAPELVTVVAAQRRHVRVLLLQGATITGLLRRFDVPQRLRLADTLSRVVVDVGGLAGFVIEASLGAVRSRVVTDADGAFSFSQLRAGEWTLRVVGGIVPDLHRLEDAEQKVVVAPGGQGSASFRVVAVTRTIRMLSPELSSGSSDQFVHMPSGDPSPSPGGTPRR